ncbi:MAG: hypothetical protein IJS83_05660 [Acholeplasmatales bacterium]|nr:hypothetical protein [Acholeplasmatales bacterium]
MRDYIKPIIEDEMVEIDDVINASKFDIASNNTDSWDNSDDNGGSLGDLLG